MHNTYVVDLGTCLLNKNTHYEEKFFLKQYGAISSIKCTILHFEHPIKNENLQLLKTFEAIKLIFFFNPAQGNIYLIKNTVKM